MWLAQRDDLPDTHKLWADPDSTLESTLRALGYVDVPAPGARPVLIKPSGAPREPSKDTVSLVDDEDGDPGQDES